MEDFDDLPELDSPEPDLSVPDLPELDLPDPPEELEVVELFAEPDFAEPDFPVVFDGSADLVGGAATAGDRSAWPFVAVVDAWTARVLATVVPARAAAGVAARGAGLLVAGPRRWSAGRAPCQCCC